MGTNILDEIVAHKKTELSSIKELYPVKLLESSIHFSAEPVSLKKYLLRPEKAGIIAEIKRKSPSKGILNKHISVEKLSIAYMQAGASALSVLTDGHYFGGSNQDLTTARKFNFCPVLRKDFTVDPYQVIEAKSIGADVILLIARILSPQQTEEFARLAKSLGLEVLLEVHSKEEIQSHVNQYIDVVGVNNRNLDTLKMDTGLSLELAGLIPPDFIKISESGLGSGEIIQTLKKAGYKGFLIGEAFMKTSHPDRACAKLIEEIFGQAQ